MDGWEEGGGAAMTLFLCLFDLGDSERADRARTELGMRKDEEGRIEIIELIEYS